MNYTLSKNACLIIVLIFVNILNISCYRNEMRSLEIHVPAMAGEVCKKVIMKQFLPLRGLEQDSIIFDYDKRMISLSYNSLEISSKNLEHAVAKAGFDVHAPYRGEEKKILLEGNPAAKKKLSPSCK